LTQSTLGLLAALVLAGSSTLSAGMVNFSGAFTHDDDVVLIPITVAGSSLITIRTTSFADGSTGFEPVLTLFDGSGNLLLQDSMGGTVPAGCDGRVIDPSSGFCLDGFIQGVLGAGSYTLALTEYDNIPGGTLSDGFPQTGNGDFTGPEFRGTAGAFVLFDGSQRTSAWALTVDGAAVPEPGTMSLLAAALVSVMAIRRRARR